MWFRSRSSRLIAKRLEGWEAWKLEGLKLKVYRLKVKG